MTAEPRDFEEALLSGYLDGELTQAEAQRVRLHLEADPRARALLGDLERLREHARTTPFRVPDDEEWDERPRTGASRRLRGGGWMLGIGGLLASVVSEVFGVAVPLQPGFAGMLLGGLGLLLVSVLLDRLRLRRTDRYRRVMK